MYAHRDPKLCPEGDHDLYFSKTFQVTGFDGEQEAVLKCRNCPLEVSGTIYANDLLKDRPDNFYRVDDL